MTIDDTNDRKSFLTTAELARELRVTTRSIRNWCKAGRIPYLKITERCFRFHRDQVKRALEKAA
jgi:excisionase family DNA binding protein